MHSSMHWPLTTADTAVVIGGGGGTKNATHRGVPTAKSVYFRGRRIMYRCCGGDEGVKQPAAVVR